MSPRKIMRRLATSPEALQGVAHPVLRRVYASRGVRSTEDLDLSLGRLLPVSTLDGIEAATALLMDHLARDSRLLVVGDFDADGATSTAVVVRQLKRLGHAAVDFRVPDRMRHGYGLTPALVADLAHQQADLIITVDNGVAAMGGVRAARAKGMEVLVTDHHLPGTELPDCAAMVNPNLKGARFGSPALAGVGVAFYLMAALTRALEQKRGEKLPAATDLLDLVALGTVADVVPLDQNNRILINEGLRRIRAGRVSPGLLALAQLANRDLSRLNERDLGYQVGPRLNAAGRIDDMAIGIRCLLAEEPAVALRLAGVLDQLNRERRDIESRMREEANVAVSALRLREGNVPAGLVLHDDGWHAGIVGLVAGRLKEQLHRPVVAFAPAGSSELRGSARSVAGVHIRDVLESIDVRHPGLMERYGGHAMAAGLTLPLANLARFSQAFDDEVSRILSPAQMQGVLESDGALSTAEISLATAEALEQGGPWGQAFPEPMFDNELAVVDTRVVAQRHLKLWLRADAAAAPIECIAFGHLEAQGAEVINSGDRIRLAYRLQRSDFGGTPKAEMKAEYIAKLP